MLQFSAARNVAMRNAQRGGSSFWRRCSLWCLLTSQGYQSAPRRRRRRHLSCFLKSNYTHRQADDGGTDRLISSRCCCCCFAGALKLHESLAQGMNRGAKLPRCSRREGFATQTSISLPLCLSLCSRLSLSLLFTIFD